MKLRASLSSVALAALALGGCSGGSLTSTSGVYFGNMRGSYPYEGYYDGYEGPIYDGYWGTDGVFYYRSGPYDRHFKAGSAAHFKHGSGGSGFQPMRGSLTPVEGVEMPQFPHALPTEDGPPLGY